METHGPSRRGRYIYQILNLATGAAYIGSTSKTIRHRTRGHLTLLTNGRHQCREFQAEWDQCGGAAFVAGILERVRESADLIAREGYWIKMYLSAGVHLYNHSRSDGTRLRCDRCGGQNDPMGRSRFCSAECRVKAWRTKKRRQR